LKRYVSDSVAFLYFLLDRLPRRANKAFREAEEGRAVMYLPTIAAAELYYLFEKRGWLEQWTELRNRMAEVVNFQYYPFNERVLNLIRTTKAKELHDKIIVLTCRAVDADGLVTNDRKLSALGEVKTIWK